MSHAAHSLHVLHVGTRFCPQTEQPGLGHELIGMSFGGTEVVVCLEGVLLISLFPPLFLPSLCLWTTMPGNGLYFFLSGISAPGGNCGEEKETLGRGRGDMFERGNEDNCLERDLITFKLGLVMHTFFV